MLPLALSACVAPHPPAAPVLWSIDVPLLIEGRDVTTLGAPRAVEGVKGRHVAFDGEDDAFVVDGHPLEGARAFTIEMVFRPAPDGLEEQRVVHLQENTGKDRILLETRLTDDGRWFLDTHVTSDGESHTLYARRFKHPIGPWYHVALIVAEGKMRHFVNGRQEMSRSIRLRPPRRGRASIGMRINERYWFRGEMRSLRFTRRALSQSELVASVGLAGISVAQPQKRE